MKGVLAVTVFIFAICGIARASAGRGRPQFVRANSNLNGSRIDSDSTSDSTSVISQKDNYLWLMGAAAINSTFQWEPLSAFGFQEHVGVNVHSLIAEGYYSHFWVEADSSNNSGQKPVEWDMYKVLLGKCYRERAGLLNFLGGVSLYRDLFSRPTDHDSKNYAFAYTVTATVGVETYLTPFPGYGLFGFELYASAGQRHTSIEFGVSYGEFNIPIRVAGASSR